MNGNLLFLGMTRDTRRRIFVPRHQRMYVGDEVSEGDATPKDDFNPFPSTYMLIEDTILVLKQEETNPKPNAKLTD